jgi:hypothetical protein
MVDCVESNMTSLCVIEGHEAARLGNHNRPFQFQEKHGLWGFAVFENASTGPWDIDRPGEEELGMHIIQRQNQEMTREDAERRSRVALTRTCS